MPKFVVEFHNLALREYDEACQWYAERSPEAAGRFKLAVDKAISRITEAPESFPRMFEKFRWIRVQRYQYILVYRPRRPGELVVIAVAHASRRPGYWRRRS